MRNADESSEVDALAAFDADGNLTLVTEGGAVVVPADDLEVVYDEEEYR